MARFMLLFAVIVLTLFALQLTPWGQTHVVIPFTSGIAALSAGLIQLWDGQVAAQGKVIWNTVNQFAVSIEAGCNGVEASIILLAAMLAFPAAWSHKLIGIISGIASVQLLNLVRIITLFYLGQWSPSAFEWAHLYIWQALIMLDVLVVFLLWLRWLPKASTPSPSPAV